MLSVTRLGSAVLLHHPILSLGLHPRGRCSWWGASEVADTEKQPSVLSSGSHADAKLILSFRCSPKDGNEGKGMILNNINHNRSPGRAPNRVCQTESLPLDAARLVGT